ncbi:MAG: PEP-CTERM sorting domain-containing protein [Planctomycetota bacterium]
MKLLMCTFLAALGVLIPAASMAQTIEAEGTFAFDTHVFAVFDRGSQSIIRDEYAVSIDSLTLSPGEYDRIEVTLRPSADTTVAVQDVGFDVRVGFDLRWAVDPSLPTDQASGATATGSFENPVGQSSPPAAESASFLFNSTDVLLRTTLNAGSGPFFFDGVTIAVDITPFTLLSETTYLLNPDDGGPNEPTFTIDYITSPALPSDPGVFTSVVPEPSSLALLGLGSMLAARRRRV